MRPAVPGQLRHDRGEVTAGAVTADRYSRRVTAEFAHVRGCPLQRGGGVFGGGGPRVLRTESVGDGDDDGGDTAGQRAGHDVAGLEAARGPPAAVVPDDDGERVSVGARRSLAAAIRHVARNGGRGNLSGPDRR